MSKRVYLLGACEGLRPFEYWFASVGGVFSKNKMPRGKKFRAAMSRYKKGEWVPQT